MKKIHVLQLVIGLLIGIFLIVLLSPKEYTKTYQVNEVLVTENFNKSDKKYYFGFNYRDIQFDYLADLKYKVGRGLIKEINILEDQDSFCLVPKGENIDLEPLCYENEEIVHFSLVGDELKKKLDTNLFRTEKELDTYKDIHIYNNSFVYLLWDYDGFKYINGEEKKKIDIIEKEIYNISKVGYTDDYLVVPDYDSNYTFNNFYVIELKSGEVKKYTLKEDIYFDSYFIGYVKNKLYIVDNKEEAMYEFNAKNGKINKIESRFLNNNKWENVSIKTLINQNKEFIYDSFYEYSLDSGKLYLKLTTKNAKTLVSRDITSIIRVKDEDIFYLKKDSLFHFNPKIGEEKLLTYFEWNFNNQNMIYIN